jgi:hypothetical protein
MANAVLPAIMLNADRVERGNRLFTAEFPTQDTGEGKTDQRAFTDDANMHEIFRVPLGVGQPLLEKTAARFTHVRRIDGDDAFEIVGA